MADHKRHFALPNCDAAENVSWGSLHMSKDRERETIQFRVLASLSIIPYLEVNRGRFITPNPPPTDGLEPA